MIGSRGTRETRRGERIGRFTLKDGNREGQEKEVEGFGQRSQLGDAGRNPVEIADVDLCEEARIPYQQGKNIEEWVIGARGESEY